MFTMVQNGCSRLPEYAVSNNKDFVQRSHNKYKGIIMKKTIITLFTAGALSACGGADPGTGTGTSTTGTTATTSVTGTVADGYLENAKVCADVNGDKVCNDDEPSAVTDEKGAYTLKLSEAQKTHPIIAEVTSDTKDADTGNFVANSYVLSAPSGKTFLSPITSMVQAKIDNNPSLDANSAAKLVKDELGASTATVDNLFEDYASDAKKNSVEHKKIYQTAQAVARAMGVIEAKLKEQFKTLGIALTPEMVRLLQKEVHNNISTISKTLYTDANAHISGGGSVDPNRAEKSLKDQQKKIDAIDVNIKAKLTKVEIERQKKILIQKSTQAQSTTPEKFVKEPTFFGSPSLNYSGDEKPELSANFDAFANGYIYFNEATDLTTFKKDYLALDEQGIINKVLIATTSPFKINVNEADGSIQFTEGRGDTITLLKVVEQSIAGLTLGCDEMWSSGNTGICDYDDSVVNQFTSKKILFSAGDLQYHFTYKMKTRFDLNTVGEKLKLMSLDNLCPTLTSSGNDDAFCAKGFDGRVTLLESNTSLDQHFSGGNGKNYFISSPIDNNNKYSIATCDSDSDYNNTTCTSEKHKIGDVYQFMLKSGESVWVFPGLDDDGDLRYTLALNKDGSTYRVKSPVSASGETKIRSYSPFNWSAYQKIFKAFTAK